MHILDEGKRQNGAGGSFARRGSGSGIGARRTRQSKQLQQPHGGISMRLIASAFAVLLSVACLDLVWLSISCDGGSKSGRNMPPFLPSPTGNSTTQGDATPAGKIAASWFRMHKGPYFPNHSSKLLERARPMALMRLNIPLDTVYRYGGTGERQFSGDCSCENPGSTWECCRRTFRRSHKFGCVATRDLLHQYEPLYRLAAEPGQFTYADRLPDADYRDVLVLRNLYSAIVSGYAYHYKGFECGMQDKIDAFLGNWHMYVSYKLDPPLKKGQTICKYLQTTPRKKSLRAYVDWVMRYYYSGILSHWALAQQIPEIRRRTLVVCYEDLMSPHHDNRTVDEIVNFFFDGRPPQPFFGIPPGHVNYTGGHATAHSLDPKVRESLIKTIRRIDKKYYNGELAWANSILPC